jgi:hypothetical protein
MYRHTASPESSVSYIFSPIWHGGSQFRVVGIARVMATETGTSAGPSAAIEYHPRHMPLVRRTVHRSLLFHVPVEKYLSQVNAAEQEAIEYFDGREDELLRFVRAADIQRMATGLQLQEGASALDARSCWPPESLTNILTPDKAPAALYSHPERMPHTTLPSATKQNTEMVRTIASRGRRQVKSPRLCRQSQQ